MKKKYFLLIFFIFIIYNLNSKTKIEQMIGWWDIISITTVNTSVAPNDEYEKWINFMADGNWDDNKQNMGVFNLDMKKHSIAFAPMLMMQGYKDFEVVNKGSNYIIYVKNDMPFLDSIKDSNFYLVMKITGENSMTILQVFDKYKIWFLYTLIRQQGKK